MNEQEIRQVKARLQPTREARRARDITVTVYDEELAALDAIAEREGRPRSALIREAVRKVWLKKENGR